MLSFDPKLQSELASREHHRIRVMGVGGAGVNMLDRIKLNKIGDFDLSVINTDQRTLHASVVDDRVQLGASLTRGLGSGGDPDLGFAAMEASKAEVIERVQNRDLIFLCGGLGGGTASGALPEMAKLARDSGAFVVAFVTMPFFFEGRRRSQQAQEALDKLNEHAHALMVFQNDRMSELVDAQEGIHAAFSKVDQLIASAVSSISNMISRPGLVHLGLDDLISALEDNRHECLFGWGEARGKKRVTEAVEQALKSPLLETEKLSKFASKVLVHICGGQDLSLMEVEEAMNEVSQHIHPNALVLFGTGVDPAQDSLQVTLISSMGNTPLLEEVEEVEEIKQEFEQATKPEPEPNQQSLAQTTLSSAAVAAPVALEELQENPSQEPEPTPEPINEQAKQVVEQTPEPEPEHQEEFTAEDTSEIPTEFSEQHELDLSNALVAAQEPAKEVATKEVAAIEEAPKETVESIEENILSTPEEIQETPEVAQTIEAQEDHQVAQEAAQLSPAPEEEPEEAQPTQETQELNLEQQWAQNEVQDEVEQEAISNPESQQEIFTPNQSEPQVQEEAQAPQEQEEVKQPIEEFNFTQEIEQQEELQTATPPSDQAQKLEPEPIKVASKVKLVRKMAKKASQTQELDTQQPTQKKSKPEDSGDLFSSAQAEKRGRFADSDPTLEDGEDLDLPTFLRKKRTSAEKQTSSENGDD